MVNMEYREENTKIRVGIALSGGVDSSTVAYLLKKQGYDIFGVTMRTCHEEDADAKKVCQDLGIEHYVLDLRDRKSTRLNSSHANISYAVFCLKKKKSNHHYLGQIINPV